MIMMQQIRIYSPALVLFLWALVWSIGQQGTCVVVGFLLATALAVVVHAMTLLHVYHNPPKHRRDPHAR